MRGSFYNFTILQRPVSWIQGPWFNWAHVQCPVIRKEQWTPRQTSLCVEAVYWQHRGPCVCSFIYFGKLLWQADIVSEEGHRSAVQFNSKSSSWAWFKTRIIILRPGLGCGENMGQKLNCFIAITSKVQFSLKLCL